MRANRFYLGFLWLLGSLFFCSVHAAIPDEPIANRRQKASDPTAKSVVGLITGGVQGTYIRIAADMATVLDNNDLRILPMIGKGSEQNIYDLLYTKGVDMAIVQADVLTYLKRKKAYKNIDKNIAYITKLYNEEFHLLASSAVTTLSDLAGRKVNFDIKGSGTAITAARVLSALKISVEPTYYDQASALEKLKSGEIAALAYVVGKPAPLFENLATNQNVHFISIDHTPELLETYAPTHLKSQDYPALIRPDQDVKTIAVGAVLAVYNWQPSRGRYQKADDFTQHFLDHFAELQQTARHPKWQEVSLSAVIPGWTRFPAAQAWLQRHAAAKNPQSPSAPTPTPAPKN